MGYIAKRFRMDQHREALAKLWAENMSDSSIARVVAERMRWLYEQNPLGETHTWFAVDEDSGEVVGCASLYPRLVSLRGKIVRAGIGMDLAVSKRHRVAGPAVILQRAVTKEHRHEGFEFTYAYPNKGSLPVVKRVGFTVIAEASHWVKPVRTGYKLGAYIQHPSLLKGASFVLDRALGLVDRRHTAFNRGSFHTSVIDVADGRFDDLWERARTRFVIVGDKSSSYLNWRYTACKTTKFSYFCLTHRDRGDLAGFAVISVKDNKVFVSDLFCEDLTTTLSHLLVGLAGYARRARHDSVFIAYAGTSEFTKRLEGLDFLQREFSRSLVAYMGKEVPEDVRKVIADKENWFLFDGELDL